MNRNTIRKHKFWHLQLTILKAFSIFLFLVSCNEKNKLHESFRHRELATIFLNNGNKIKSVLSKTDSEWTQGLSGIEPEYFPDNYSMLFYGKNDESQRFWMPDTYFNLDIFFLDKNFKVIGVNRNMPAHPGRKTPPAIQYTDTFFARHVLEVASDSPYAKQISVGDILKISF